MPHLHFMVPGDPASATGGYEYDRQVIAGLRRLGWQVQLHCLDGSFPQPSTAALADARHQLSNLADDAWVLIDGLALGAMPEVVREHEQRLRLMALVHHPLADETGVPRDEAQRLLQTERAALQSMRFVVTTGQAMVSALAEYVNDPRRIGVVSPGVSRVELDGSSEAGGGDISSAERAHLGMEHRSLLHQEVALDAVAPMPAHQSTAVTGASHPAGDNADSLQLLCVATLTPRKGHELLIDALASLQDLPWRLECVGDTSRSPATFQTLQRRIAEAGLESRITFTGVLDDPDLRMRWSAADIFVLATHFEGYGMAVADALLHGIPVVSTRTGEIASLVGDDAGIVVAPGDKDALRAALSEVMGNQGTRRRMATAAAQRGAALPDWDAASQRLAALVSHGAQLPTIREAA